MKKEVVMDVVDLIEAGGRPVIDWNENHIVDPKQRKFYRSYEGDNVEKVARETERAHKK
jgi:nicotinic acid phosphoribosyltransferase